MIPGLHTKTTQAAIFTVLVSLCGASFGTAHAEDKPGFFKKLFGAGNEEAPPAPEPKPVPKPVPAKKPAVAKKSTPKPSTETGKAPRVIITKTKPGSGTKKVEPGKSSTSPTTAKTTSKPAPAIPPAQPPKDVTSTAKRGEGEFKPDDDGQPSTLRSEAVAVLPANGGWEIVKIGGRDYVTADSVRNFYNPLYGFTTFRLQGNHFWLGSSKLILKAQVGSQEILINNIKFILSFPVQSHNGKVLFSRLDLCKLIDPVLCPSHIQNAEYFDTVVIDAGHGGHDAGARGI